MTTPNGTGTPTRTSVLLSVQRALLDRVVPALRAVVVSWSSKEVHARCFFNGEIASDIRDEISCAETEVLADFVPEVTVRFECIRVDAPCAIDAEGEWVYARREER